MALFAFCDQRYSLNTDTLCKYASLAKEISLVQKDITNMAMAEYYVANCFVKRGSLDTAYKICEDNILKLKNKSGSSEAIMKLTILKTQVLIRSTKYKEGIAEAFSILQLAEKNNDTLSQMIAKNAIGWANMEMDQKPEALRWLLLALRTTDRIDYHEKNSNIYSNIAAVYNQLQQYDSAEYFILKSISFARKNENLFYLANCLNILADIYIDTKRPLLAEEPFNEALLIRKQIGDPFYIVADMGQLADFYAKTSQSKKGIAISLEAIEIATKLNLTAKLAMLYEALGENYKVAGNYKEYSKALEKSKSLTDSMYVANTAEAIAELDARYNLQKKENLINIQKLDIAKKNSLLFASLFLLTITILISWQIFREYKKNQQIKLLKMQTEEKLLSTRAVMSAEENERKRISRDLHDNIGAYATVLMANTERLKKQAAGQPVQQSADSIFENAQNIIGSLQETIWVLNNDVITITDFIDRFKMYAKKMLQHFTATQIRFKEQLDDDVKLSPAEALHLFRIMQEALQNIIKHAGSKNIIVEIKSKETIEISIKDDGNGFDKNIIMEGNGLLNMRHRANEAGYHLNILSSADGTEIKLIKNNSFAV
ncbi:MAG TPA: tetratricopeptide repeat protein [Chitinophagaceae bacterium]